MLKNILNFFRSKNVKKETQIDDALLERAYQKQKKSIEALRKHDLGIEKIDASDLERAIQDLRHSS